jgi:tetratricopeptide (TPR) repeat protein
MTRWFRFVVLAAAVIYAATALWGVRAALAYRRGTLLAAAGRYDEALPLLDRGAFGFNAAEAAWLAGEVALGLADAAPDAAARAGALQGASERYVTMLERSTGSSYALTGLASALARAEASDRARRVIDIAALSRGPWALVGPNGRDAVGLLRVAAAREPATCAPHDALVNLLVGYGLIDEAETAARRAAHAAPAFEYHEGLDPDRLPASVVAAFAAGAREALDAAPLAARERKLFYLGRLDERIGELEEAVVDLRAAHEQPAPKLERAESAFHLGRVLARLGRAEEAEAAWREAEEAPVFGPALAIERARLAEVQGRPDDALRQVAEGRRLAPRRMDLILWEARLLAARGDRAEALETLRWGVTVDGSDRAPRIALIEQLIAVDDRVAAEEALTDLERRLGAGDDSQELRRQLESTP